MYYKQRGTYGGEWLHKPMIYPAGTPLDEMRFADCLVCGAEWAIHCDIDSDGEPILESGASGSRVCKMQGCGDPREYIRLLKAERERDIAFAHRMRWYDDPRQALGDDHAHSFDDTGHCWCGDERDGWVKRADSFWLPYREHRGGMAVLDEELV